LISQIDKPNFSYCIPIEGVRDSYGETIGGVWATRRTLALMVLKTLEALGPLHGYGIARRIEQTSGNLLSLNYGTLYPALLKLEQEGAITAEWGVSENNRRAKFYSLTKAGRRQLQKEAQSWEQTTAILARFLASTEDPA
jgi:PadR family transcriptional regulator PadR